MSLWPWSTLSFGGVTLLGILLLAPDVAGGSNGDGDMLRLEDDLFTNYKGVVRPVKDGISPTVVTFRLLLYALLEMTWTDEFLTWNTTEYGGIDVVYVKAERLWLPDMSLIQTVDDNFERFKLDTYAFVTPDGFVTWYSPAIFGASCRMHVRYFPFDTQACGLQITSWSYNGLHIDLQLEDVEQYLFITNGVWELKDFKSKRITTYYQCCPEPYYEIQYVIIFRRSSEFYVSNLILPCGFLSMLSLLVFYLPPDCGEKLTLSITNLLALVVFQQLIAETLPPSGEESPIIGTYFLLMIVMVCVSVVFSVIVIHVGFKKTPMPSWVETLIIKCLGRCVCVKGLSTVDKKADLHFSNDKAIEAGNSETTYPISGELNTRHSTSTPWTGDAYNISKEEMLEKWQLASMIIDRVLLIMFTCFIVIVTVIMVSYVVVKSNEDFARLINETYEL